MIQLLIVADDFTGALDTGVQLAKQGCRTSVTTRYPPDFFTDPGAYTGSGSGYTEQAFTSGGSVYTNIPLV